MIDGEWMEIEIFEILPVSIILNIIFLYIECYFTKVISFAVVDFAQFCVSHNHR